MSLKFRIDQEWTEAIINDNCDFDEFYRIADILETILKIRFFEKLNGLESAYWGFEYDGCKLTLHYNILVGISIFPQGFKQSTAMDNKKVSEVGALLLEEVSKR